MQLMASVLDDFSQGFRGRGSARGVSLPLRNRLLPRFLKKLGVEQREVPYDPEAPFAELLADEVKCNACEACIQVCPTEAFERGGGDEAFHLTVDASRCVNCALCLDACIPNALTYRQGLSLERIAWGEQQMLVEKAYHRCGRCEVRFLANGDLQSQDLCPTCHYFVETERSETVPEEGTEVVGKGETGSSRIEQE
jgi:ferredoxin